MIFSTESIILKFSFSEIIDKRLAIVKLSKEIRIVNNLSTKVLIKMNIINFESMTINVNILFIINYKDIKIELSTTSKEISIKRIIICTLTITIFFHINIKVSIKLQKKESFFNRDYMFYSKRSLRLNREEEIFFHIMDSNFSDILITNSSNELIKILKRSRLNLIKEFDEKNCYMIFLLNAHLIANN